MLWDRLLVSCRQQYIKFRFPLPLFSTATAPRYPYTYRSSLPRSLNSVNSVNHVSKTTHPHPSSLPAQRFYCQTFLRLYTIFCLIAQPRYADWHAVRQNFVLIWICISLLPFRNRPLVCSCFSAWLALACASGVHPLYLIDAGRSSYCCQLVPAGRCAFR
jgi:hypothetical protein